MRHLWLLILTLSSCLALASPAQVIIIRHAEKPATGPNLSPVGYQHAQELVPYFENDPAVTQFGLPAAIYAFRQRSPNSSNRAVETVTPLAEALGLTIDSRFLIRQVSQLAADVLSNPAYDGKMVLLCWEHEVIPALAAALGVSPQPGPWSGADFDSVYRIDFSPQGQVTDFQILTQQLTDAPGPARYTSQESEPGRN